MGSVHTAAFAMQGGVVQVAVEHVILCKRSKALNLKVPHGGFSAKLHEQTYLHTHFHG